MSQPLLSILIPTVVGREDLLKRLLDKICHPFNLEMHRTLADDWTWGFSFPMGKEIEVFYYLDDKKITIGEKREILYNGCHGKYAWQIDEDDDISDNAIELILQAIEQNPDCITFEEYVNIDGREYKSNHSLSYPDWNGDGNGVLGDGFHFQRTPFFKSVIKTEIARKVPIPHIRFGEDHEWSRALKPHLHSEVHIPEQIYRYLHKSSDFNERYGITS